MSSIKKRIFLFVILAIVLLIVFSLDIIAGSVHIPIKDIFSIILGGKGSMPEWVVIINDYRIPKAWVALFAGMALSVSGLQMQTIFRNPLAGPYILGITSGASLGVATLILGYSYFYKSNYISYIGNLSVVMAAWAGAFLVLLLVLSVSLKVRDIMTLLILGMLFTGAAGALVNILQYFSNESMLKSFVVWTMGSLSGLSAKDLYIFIPSIFIGLILSLILSKNLNIMLLGEEYARSLGLNIRITRWMSFISTCILTGTVTAFCGPIGFLGTAVPHLCRMIFHTSNHWILNVGCMLVGSIFLLFGDIISQIPGTNFRLPIDAVTALLGIPVIVWIILRNFRFASL